MTGTEAVPDRTYNQAIRVVQLMLNDARLQWERRLVQHSLWEIDTFGGTAEDRPE